MKKLEEVRNNILNDSNDLLINEKISIVDITLSMEKNKLIIGVKDNNYSITQKLLELYGDNIVEVEEVEELNFTAARSDYNSKIQGGLRIQTANGGGCTIGATVKRDGNYYALTAGHCSAVGTAWSQGGKALGTMKDRMVGGSVDAGIIEISSDRAGKYMYVHSSNDALITGEQSPSNEVVGGVICKTGASTGGSCGTLLDKNYAVKSTLGVQFKGVRKANYNSAGGDSGGSVFTTDYKLAGIHIMSNGEIAVYSHIANIGSYLSVDLYY